MAVSGDRDDRVLGIQRLSIVSRLIPPDREGMTLAALKPTPLKSEADEEVEAIDAAQTGRSRQQ